MKRESSKDINIRIAGFTVIELLVGIGLFAMVMTALTGAFLTTFRSQRQAFAFLATQNNVRYALEKMAREMRTGSGFSSSQTDLISFTNDKGESVTYCLAGSAIRRDSGACSVNSPAITASNVIVERLRFVLDGASAGDGRQPRITILVRITSGQLSADVQTTVVERNLDS